MPAAATTNIIIFGGTGVIGKYITDAILKSKSNFGRVALFTSSRTVETKTELLQPWKDLGLDLIVGDITKDDDIAKALKGFDTVISAVGRGALESQFNLIRLAEESPDARRLFPSEFGTDIEYFPNSKDEKPHQQKLKVRAYIKDHVRKLEYTYLVTGPYADMYIDNLKAAPKAGTFDVKSKKAVLLGDGEGKISLTSMADVGKLLVGALKHPEESKNKALKVNSFTTTPNEIYREYAKQTGGTWDVTYQSLEELKKAEEKAWAEGNPAATSFTLRRIWTEGGTLYKERDNERIGVTDTDSLDKVVAIVVKKQLAGIPASQ